MNDDNLFRTHFTHLGRAEQRDPARLWDEYTTQLQIWEVGEGEYPVPAHGVIEILKDFIDEGWELDDVFIERVYRDANCERFDRDLVRAYRDARSRGIGGFEIGD